MTANINSAAPIKTTRKSLTAISFASEFSISFPLNDKDPIDHHYCAKDRQINY